MITIGNRLDGQPWRIGLQIPSRDRGVRDRIWGTLDCRDAAIVTSGSYERGFEKNGRWYHHILDPRTGMPVETEVQSVTVWAETSLLADALTTPMQAKGDGAGRPLRRSGCILSEEWMDSVYQRTGSDSDQPIDNLKILSRLLQTGTGLCRKKQSFSKRYLIN